MASHNHAAEAVKVAVVGIPVDQNSSFRRGASAAPPLVRLALSSDATNMWAENRIDLGSGSCLVDAGDLAGLDGPDMVPRIETSVRLLLERQLRPIALGGDHSITYPLVRAVSGKHPGLTILDFDAHSDLYDEFQGNRLSHACPFARIMEEGLARRLVQIGIRTMNGPQRRQAEKFGIEVVEMKDWRGVLPALQSPVYISFDLDVLDPAFAPGVSHREPGGLSVREALQAIQAVNVEIVGADIVEYNPQMDVMNLTATVCAKLLKEIAASMLATAGAC